MTIVRHVLDPRREDSATAVREALLAVERARTHLRATGDPLAAAVDSALSCAASLIVLRQADADIDALRDVLGAARALVGEVTFAVRECHHAHA